MNSKDIIEELERIKMFIRSNVDQHRILNYIDLIITDVKEESI
jgi:hypothetical protein